MNDACASGRHCLVRQYIGGRWFLVCINCPHTQAE